jgi:glutamate carboxypeptidase
MSKGNKILGAIFVLLSAVFSFGQTLSGVEKKIAENVDRRNDELLTFLAKTVDVESPTEDLAGVRAVGMMFKKELEALGFKSRWIEMPAEMKRAGHLIAEHRGGKGKRILLIGHLDTVLRGEKFKREGNIAYGTGIGDMKGGNAIILYALRALKESGQLEDMNVTVFFTGDEENSGDPVEISRGDMIEAAKNSDLVLSFENGSNTLATVARRGIGDWELVVEAKTGHSSAIFKDWMGSGAIFEASRILNVFYTTLRDEKYLTFNPGLFVGGTSASAPDFNGTASGKTNVVAAKAIVRGDLRYISKDQEAAAREKMRQIVAQSLPGTSAKITFFDGIPAMAPTPANYELLKVYDQSSRDLGLGEVKGQDPGERGAGDISYVAHLIPGLDGLGAVGGKAHAVGEFIDVDRLQQQTKRTAVTLYRLTR